MPNVTLSALKPHGNPLAAGRPGGLPADRVVTVRLRETEGMTSLVRVRASGALGGIEAAWRASLLEEEDDSGLPVSDGTALVGIGPFETVTAVLRLGPAPGSAPAALAAPAAAPLEPPVPPEPVQPVHARYWLHGKGPAPAGNVPVAVHVTPTRITLGGYSDGAGFGEGDPAVPLQLSVACGPEPASGAVELLVPDGLLAEIDGAPVTADAPLPFDIPGHGFTTWDVVVRARPGADAGRYFVAARIRDGLGQLLEDTALVTIGEPGAPDASQPPEELFFRLQSDVQGMVGEADLEVLTPELRLAPGERGELTVRVASHLASGLRGELQLISPIGTWRATAPWTQAVTVPSGGEAAASFAVTVPATAEPGWQSWLLVKLMYFGRVRYSRAVPLTVT